MQPDQVMTESQFNTFVEALVDNTPYNGTLEEYLRSLWGLIQTERATHVSWALLARLLRDAFTSEPVPFDEEWLTTYVSMPALDATDPGGQSFELLQQMILFQIADLRRMAASGDLDNPLRYFGINSPTGHRWYNLHPSSFLERSVADMKSDDSNTNCSWNTLRILLWFGQMYE